MASMSRALMRVKQDLAVLLPDAAIADACRAAGHRWRRRLLDPVTTVQLFVLQVLNFNTSLTHLRHLAGRAVKPSAYCQARMRLPLAAMQGLLRTMCDRAGAAGRFLGHRVLLVDGSSSGLPDTKALQKVFPQPKRQRKGCGFPVAKLLGLFDAATGLLVEMLPCSLHTHEQSKVSGLHPLLQAGDVVLGDRGLCSFWHAAMLATRRVLCCFRMHQAQIVNFRPHRKSRGQAGKKQRAAKRAGEWTKARAGKRDKGRPTSTWVRRLGKHDQVVRWAKPKARPAWMTPELFDTIPDELEVREIRYRIPRKGQRTQCVTIATTLLDPTLYPREKIAELYKLRWEVETHFRELKTTMRMRVLKCKTPDGVKKELLAFALAYNLVRLVMAEAARRQEVEVSRISFIDALRWLLCAAPGEAMPDLVVNPLRPDRHEPRCIKRRAKQYDLMTRPRAELRKRLRTTKVKA